MFLNRISLTMVAKSVLGKRGSRLVARLVRLPRPRWNRGLSGLGSARWALGRSSGKSSAECREPFGGSSGSTLWEAERFDRRLGIDTAGRLEPTELTIAAGEPSQGITYLGTQPRLARWWLAALPPEPERFTFIDMGSGKGRVLVFAVQHGFRRSVGVEFAQELHDVAVENARILGDRGIAIEPVLGDAGAFEFRVSRW